METIFTPISIMKKKLSSARQEALSVTLSLLAVTALTTVVAAHAQLDASGVNTPASASASVSSKPMSKREEARLKRLQRQAERKGRTMKTSSSSSKMQQAASSSAPEPETTPHPSARTLRNATSPQSQASEPRPTVILEKAGCGDGLVIPPESCDDGNKFSGDGCSSACAVESGFTCNFYVWPTKCWYRCGDGQRAPSLEECDDGNADGGDGCNPYCKKEPGWTCSAGTPDVCTVIPFCGNQIIEGSETCDDGNVHNGDGCSSACSTETSE